METRNISEELDKKLIIRDYRKLLRYSQSVINKDDLVLIKKAFKISLEAHKDMRRKSGEPYILHPLTVAQICVKELGLDSTSIICALLHDVKFYLISKPLMKYRIHSNQLSLHGN